MGEMGRNDWNSSLQPDYLLKQGIYSLPCRKRGGILGCLVFLTSLLKLVETKYLKRDLYVGKRGEHDVWQNTNAQCLPLDK